MTDPQAKLKILEPKHDFLIAIDSDGCAFDTMEIKHKECFIPNIIKYWHLQPVSKYARAAAEFVNLYSKWRGINRFPALTLTLDLLNDWNEVHQRGFLIPEAQAVRDWIKRETRLGNPALKAEIERSNDPGLKQALEWSEAVNASIADMVHDVPPFPFVGESLQKVSQWADIIVCSATPNEALEREWEEHDIAQYARIIAGQEMGSKKEHLALVKSKYPAGNIIMIGDAPGDMQSAHVNGLLFFPINPGQEAKSWEKFYQEYADLFGKSFYNKAIEGELIAEFDTYLPDTPPWK